MSTIRKLLAAFAVIIATAALTACAAGPRDSSSADYRSLSDDFRWTHHRPDSGDC